MDYGNHTLGEFLDGLAGATTPAGGSAAAVSGAMGAALCEMVCEQSVAAGGEGEGEGEGEAATTLVETRDDLRARRDGLLRLAGEDADAVEGLFLADAPDETDRERALEVPISVAEACLAVLEAAAVVADHAEGIVAVDAATGAILARAGLRAAALTVRTNADGTGDAAAADRATTRAREAETAGDEALEAVLAAVERGG